MNHYMYPGILMRNEKGMVITPKMTIQFVAECICKEYKITMDQMKSKSRKREYAECRQVICYLVYKHFDLNISLEKVGSFLGNRDHTTVIYACKNVQNLLDTDVFFKRKLEKLLEKLTM